LLKTGRAPLPRGQSPGVLDKGHTEHISEVV